MLNLTCLSHANLQNVSLACSWTTSQAKLEAKNLYLLGSWSDGSAISGWQCQQSVLECCILPRMEKSDLQMPLINFNVKAIPSYWDWTQFWPVTRAVQIILAQLVQAPIFYFLNSLSFNFFSLFLLYRNKFFSHNSNMQKWEIIKIVCLNSTLFSEEGICCIVGDDASKTKVLQVIVRYCQCHELDFCTLLLPVTPSLHLYILIYNSQRIRQHRFLR